MKTFVLLLGLPAVALEAAAAGPTGKRKRGRREKGIPGSSPTRLRSAEDLKRLVLEGNPANARVQEYAERGSRASTRSTHTLKDAPKVSVEAKPK